MDSKVGCSWRQLELRGQQNAAKSKQIFGANSSIHTFVVENENDGNSLLRFMKVVVPEYRELIPPPCLSTGFRPVQVRHTARIPSIESIGAPAPRQFRQSTETTMALNAFSDLEAIAEMGAGTDDTESPQLSETVAHSASKLAGRGSPNSGNNFSTFTTSSAVSSAICDQRVRATEQQQNMSGGNSDPSQLAHLSLEHQQRQRLGLNVVYRQQQPKQSVTPMGAVNAISGNRLIMDTQSGLRHSSCSDVFNFVPDHPPFEDTPTFGNVSSTPYQSPTGGVQRRRGRGRRAGNFGDRQPSTSSSVEHEGTPDSPSEFGTLRKPRGVGQRRARKPRKPANMSFEQDSGGISRSPFQCSETHAQIGHVPPFSAPPANYISAQVEEDFRSKMTSVYEMGICESSTDDEEMDPPPPPKELMAPPGTASIERKMTAESDICCAVVTEKSEGADESGEAKKCLPPLAKKCNAFSSHNQSSSVETEPTQNMPLLHDIKLTSVASSLSASSSPSFSQLSEQSDNRTLIAGIVKTEQQDISKKQQRTIGESPANAADDSEVDATNSKKKEGELDRLKQAPETLAQSNPPFSSGTPKESSAAKKESADLTAAKRPALVLKIKKDGGASSAASTKHSSSSSSPSSTSSSTAAPPALSGPTLQQQQLNEPVARLSSNAAPPSKYKQQRQQTKRPAGKDEAVAVPPVKKKQRKTADVEGQSSSPSLIQQNRTPTTLSLSNTATTKWVKEASMATKSGSTLKKELALPNVMSHITSPFPNLKNFKIPKVVESADPPPSTSGVSQLIPNKGGPTEHQSQSNQPSGSIGEKSSRNKFGPFKSLDHFEQRRPGGGTAKQTTKGTLHQPAQFQFGDKFMGTGGGVVGNSFQPHNPYNRQRTQKQPQMGGGGRHVGPNPELARKQHRNSQRPMLSSSAAGHRFAIQFQQNSRDAGQVYNQQQHHPLHTPLQHFPVQQQHQQLNNLAWQAVQPSSGEPFHHHHQQNHNYLPPQLHQQRTEWTGHPNDQTEQRQAMGHFATVPTRSNQPRVADRQSSNCREEDRTDNSPSAGNGLQIVDDE